MGEYSVQYLYTTAAMMKCNQTIYCGNAMSTRHPSLPETDLQQGLLSLRCQTVLPFYVDAFLGGWTEQTFLMVALWGCSSAMNILKNYIYPGTVKHFLPLMWFQEQLVSCSENLYSIFNLINDLVFQFRLKTCTSQIIVRSGPHVKITTSSNKDGDDL